MDRWRTALFIAYLSEHPGLRVVGVVGQVGLVLESALDELVAFGWINPQLRASIPLAYEVTDEGRGWYLFHHFHMFIGMSLAVTVATDAPAPAPRWLRLECSPNPFNPRTTIKFDVPEAGPVRLSVFDVAGRLVRTLVDDSMPQGSHEAVWDGTDSSGREVGSGSYLARLEFGGKVETVRMGLVR